MRASFFPRALPPKDALPNGTHHRTHHRVPGAGVGKIRGKTTWTGLNVGAFQTQLRLPVACSPACAIQLRIHAAAHARNGSARGGTRTFERKGGEGGCVGMSVVDFITAFLRRFPIGSVP